MWPGMDYIMNTILFPLSVPVKKLLSLLYIKMSTMDSPAMIRHFPFLMRISCFIDISTDRLSYFLVLLRSFSNLVLLATTIWCMVDNSAQNNPLSQVHHLIISLMFIATDILFSWNKTSVTLLARFFTRPLGSDIADSLYGKVTQNYLKDIHKYSVIFSAQVMLGTIMWVSILVYLLVHFSASTANNYIRLPLGWTPMISDSYVYILSTYVFSMAMCIWNLGAIFPCYMVMLCVVLKIKYKVGILCCNLEALESRAQKRCEEEVAALTCKGRVPVCKVCLRSSRTLMSKNLISWKVTTNTPFWSYGPGGTSGPRKCCTVAINEATYRACLNTCLREVLCQHLEIIQSVRLLDKTFSIILVLFNQLGIIVPVLAMPKFASINNKTTSEYLYRGTEVLACIVFLTFFNYFGQLILNEDCLFVKSENVRRALYNCKWINKPNSFCRDLLIMQTVASRPLQLKTGGFQTLSLQNYTKILSAAYSYASLLQSMKND